MGTESKKDKRLNNKGKPRKSENGRPTKHKPEYNEQAFKLCLLGATDESLADFFNVSIVTINAWKNKPETGFLKSLRAGKDDADANVAKSLYNRAMGYSHKEDKILSNSADPENPIIVPTTKHYPPDATSAIFWLSNRQRGKWKQKQEVEHSGEVGITFDLDYGLQKDLNIPRSDD